MQPASVSSTEDAEMALQVFVLNQLPILQNGNPKTYLFEPNCLHAHGHKCELCHSHVKLGED